jgi:superfamily II DNA or RNA helicase
LYQTLEAASDLLEIPKEEIGIMGDTQFSVGNWLTIATADSLHSKLFNKQIPKELQQIKWECMIVDEVHSGSALTWYEVMDVIPAKTRIGMSGTPLDRSDGNTLRLIAQTGPIIYEVTNKTLVERGISVQPLVKLIRIETPKIPVRRNKKKVTWGEAYDEGITNNIELNIKVVEELQNQLFENKQVIVMVDRIEHGENILTHYNLSSRCNFPIKFIHGQLDSEERSQAIQDFKDGKIRALISTSILNQGVDMDCIDTLILSSGGKALIPLLQRIGRGLRTGKGRDSLLIIDFMNNCHKFFIEHSIIRLQTYKQQECFKLI